MGDLMDKTPEEDLLKALTADRAACWIDVAETLAGLEALSRVSQNGRAWHDVMKDHLATLGLQISSGHIYKIRRAYSFLKKHVPSGMSVDQLRRVKVSAVEVSERLFRLDPAAGLRALHEAVADDPTPYVELHARYESAMAAQPAMKSPRQLAWDTRRSGHPPKVEAGNQTAEGEKKKTSRSHGPLVASHEPVPSQELTAAATTLLQQSWAEGRSAGLAENRELIRQKDEEIDELRRIVEDLKSDFKILYPAFLEWRGYDYAVDWKDFDNGFFDWPFHRDLIHED